MANKKKFLGMFLFTLFVTFYGFTLKNTCNAYTSVQDPHLDYEEFIQVINKLELNNFSGDTLITVHKTYNRWVSVMIASDYNIQLSNILFYKNVNNDNNTLNWVINNGTVGDFPYIAIGRYNDFSGTVPDSTTANIYLGTFNNFNYNNSGDVTGINVGNPTRYYISISNPTTVSQQNNSKLIVSGSSNNPTTVNINEIYIHNLIAFFKPTSVVYSRTQNYGAKTFFLSNILDLERTSSIITPTPIPTTPVEPTSDPTGGGGGSSVDLTETNELITETNELITETNELITESNTSINNINENLNNTPSGDDFELPSSGDLVSSLGISDFSDFPEVQATDNFWLTITNGLYSALTSDVRYYDIDFLGLEFTLDNQAFIITNQDINSFLSIVEVVAFVFVEYKIIRKLVNMFSSGVFSQIMRAYGKIDISDLF